MKEYRLQRIDELLISQHFYLDAQDECYFFGEYASRQGYNHSKMNDLIQNFKKPMDRKNNPEWKWKQSAITDIVELIIKSSGWNKFKEYTWIPLPPSNIKGHPNYDDRLSSVLHKLKENYVKLDVKEVIEAKEDRLPQHLPNSPRLTIAEHPNKWQFNELELPLHDNIILFDDVITTGATFKAAQKLINEKFPNSLIIGLFIARAITVDTAH